MTIGDRRGGAVEVGGVWPRPLMVSDDLVRLAVLESAPSLSSLLQQGVLAGAGPTSHGESQALPVVG
jgi:hypothetical protein